MSKKALISPNEPRQTGYRVAEVVDNGQEFPVGEPMFWKSCPDNIVSDQFWYDPVNESFIPMGVNIASITFDLKTATLTTWNEHNLISGESITLSGQQPANYSGTYDIVVLNPNSFTYTMQIEPSEDAKELGKYIVNT